MVISEAKRNPVKGVTTFYVQRTLRSQRHIVQYIDRITWPRARRPGFFCDCKDFMCRKLPHIGTNAFSGCIHIKALRKRLKRTGGAVRVM